MEKGYLKLFSGSLCYIFDATQRIAGKAKV